MSWDSDISDQPFMPMPDAYDGVSGGWAEQNNGGVYGVLCSVLFGVSVVCLGARVGMVVWVRREGSWSDATCFLAAVFINAYYILCIVGIRDGFYGCHSWTVTVGELTQSKFYTISYAINLLLSPALLLLKLSIFLLYHSLFSRFPALKLAITIGATISTVFYALIFILTLALYTPRKGESFAEHVAGPLAQKTVEMSIATVVISLVLGLWLLVVPVVGVCWLQMPRGRKVAAGCVCGMGGMACFVGVLTLFYRVKLMRTRDLLWDLMPVLTTSAAEMQIGLIASCAPSVALAVKQPCVERYMASIRLRFNRPSTEAARCCWETEGKAQDHFISSARKGSKQSELGSLSSFGDQVDECRPSTAVPDDVAIRQANQRAAQVERDACLDSRRGMMEVVDMV